MIHMYFLLFFCKIDGKIQAPNQVKDWGGKNYEYWLSFDKVSHLTITGSGLLDPHGESWWPSVKLDSRPQVLQNYSTS